MCLTQNTIVLFSPKIPHNTGSIARLCAVTNTSLHLVGALGFLLDEKHLRRAGLDYWKHIDVKHYPDIQKYMSNLQQKHAYLFSTKASRLYTEVDYNNVTSDDNKCYLCFGSEISGVSQEVRHIFDIHNNVLRIPMYKDRRCLNLAVSVGIVIYETLRQQNFTNLQ